MAAMTPMPSVATPPEGISSRAAAGSTDEALALFLGVRSRLFGVAYRILGSATDA